MNIYRETLSELEDQRSLTDNLRTRNLEPVSSGAEDAKNDSPDYEDLQGLHSKQSQLG